ncbi:MAG: CRISPR-associated endonuclease Cas6 [Bacteroidia bacterium]
MAKKLKVLKIVFDGAIRDHELPAFRGAIANKVPQHILFHNHLDDNRFRYKYPLIQYKRFGQHPGMICLGEGVEEIHHYFEQRDWSISISGRSLDLKIDQLDMNQVEVSLSDRSFTYDIRNWIAINQRSMPDYRALESLGDQIAYLERKLTGNILSFAKGIDWHVESEIQTKILEMGKTHTVRTKGVNLMGFNLLFRSNMFLPNDIGLGARVSLGFGNIRRKK